jgi:hypothetical protein
MDRDFVAWSDFDVVVEDDMSMQAFAGLLDLDAAADVETPRL